MLSQDELIVLSTPKFLEFDWQGTRLGIRVEGESTFTYVELKGETGVTGPQGLPGDLIINPPPTTDINASQYPLGVYCFGQGAVTNSPFSFATTFGFNQSISRHVQFQASPTNPSLKFRTFHTSFASPGASPWYDFYNSGNLTLGTLSHTLTGNLFTGNVGDYRYSDSPFQRYCMTFNAYTSSTASSGYRFRNTGHAFWIDQRSSSGDIWFNSSTASGNAGEAVTVRSLFSFQTSTNRLLFYQRLSLANLPTSATGLIVGDLWRDSNGFLRVV